MRHKNFIVLTGHLDEVALPDLIQTLHAQRKSGRLQVEYAEAPGLFYFEEGRLVDALLGDLRGLEALYLALSLPGASFNFNPLIKPPERTFSPREQRHVRELLEGARAGGAMDVALSEGGGAAVVPLKSAHTASLSRAEQPVDARLALTEPEAEGVLTRLSQVETALATHSKRFSRERAVYAALIALLLLITFVPLLLSRMSNEARSAPATHQAAPMASSGASATRANEGARQPTSGDALRPDGAALDPERRASEATESVKPKTAASSGSKPAKPPLPATQSGEPNTQDAARRARPGGEHVVQVSMKVQQGRVVEAAIKNPQAGMASYEALALRMARQRRYPDDFNGPDTFQLKVRP